jgi:hypothetical protein
MRSRLFKLQYQVTGCALTLALSACGSQFMAGTGSASGNGGSGNAGGGTDAGGGAGDTSSTGGSSGDTTSAAGNAGEPPATCNCGAGSYCQDGTTTCLSCSVFSRLQFAAPEKLGTLSQTGSQRFPRSASQAGSDLFYRSGAADAGQVWYAPASKVGHPLAAAGALTSAPLLAPGVLQQNFFFDQLLNGDGGAQRHIMLGNWSGTALSGVTSAPEPLNSTASDFSIAVAAGVARAYWMSTRNGAAEAELLWAEMLDGAPTTPAVLDLKVQAGSTTCPRSGDDATPWVNAAGTLLLFRSPSVDDTCAPSDSGAFDLYAVPLSKATGLPTAPAVPLSALNTIGGRSNESDPSLSSDSCTLYFASYIGTADADADADLYMAQRN